MRKSEFITQLRELYEGAGIGNAQAERLAIFEVNRLTREFNIAWRAEPPIHSGRPHAGASSRKVSTGESGVRGEENG